MNSVTGSPIPDPTVTVGAKTLTVRYSVLAEYKISEAGLNPADLLRSLSPTSEDPKRFFYILNLFAACVAHNYAPMPAPTAQEWAENLAEIEPDTEKYNVALKNIGAAVVAAVLKRWPVPSAVADPAQADRAN